MFLLVLLRCFFLSSLTAALPSHSGYCSGMTLCQIDGNPIRSQEMMRKYKLGFDHLVDFLEKRMICKSHALAKQTLTHTCTLIHVRTLSHFLIFSLQNQNGNRLGHDSIRQRRTNQQRTQSTRGRTRFSFFFLRFLQTHSKRTQIGNKCMSSFSSFLVACFYYVFFFLFSLMFFLLLLQ